jgi:uncharacterized membrane protein YheB (UPF0754 family)
MKFIVASLVGAIIGYITNWLAIKMLFRPHEEKEIFGIKLPFTPGLIPKERERIAKSVGETVGTHLLSKDDVISALCSPKMNEQLEKWVDRKIVELKSSDKTIKENINGFIKEDYEKLNDSINEYASNTILNSLKEEALMQKLETEIENVIRKEFEISPEKMLENKKVKEITANITDKIKELKDSPYIKIKVEEYINSKMKELEESNKNIEDIIPQSLINSVKVYIYNSRDEICLAIKEMLNQQDVEDKLKEAINSMISSNLSPLVSMFINVDTIYSKLRGAIEDYLKEDENQRNIALLVNNAVEKMAKSSISEIIEKLEQDENKLNIQVVSEFIVNSILSNDIIDNTAVEMELYFKRFNSLHEIASSFEEDYIRIISSFIADKIKDIIESESFRNNVKVMVSSTIDQQLSRTFGSVINNNEEKIKMYILQLVQDMYQRFIDNEALVMVETLNIPSIVEEKINAFDVAFAEKLIIDIAHKELSAITWLGALLGGIIGILSPILGSL